MFADKQIATIVGRNYLLLNFQPVPNENKGQFNTYFGRQPPQTIKNRA
ncbi:hypothetical protein JCM19239_3506 [Vibrio variabilis]|uniref:Uncharacterized protein n=1 Tax=Vibrio variabilis TaxID=990271 RepID=A0ABQ0JKM5_9VIBR|nr:hypothetical protein JCM19239_3506 [Vibrio variabilis]